MQDLFIMKELQQTALIAADEVFQELEVGMTEKDVTKALDHKLKSHGVQKYFHYPYAWFGDRTSFQNISKPLPFLKSFNLDQFSLPSLKNPLPHFGIEFLPTKRKLEENTAVILDIAPIRDEYFCDIGYANFFGESEKHTQMKDFLKELRGRIPNIVKEKKIIHDIDYEINFLIEQEGYQSCHKLYPLEVLGHKVGNIKNLPFSHLFNIVGFSPEAYLYLLKQNVLAPLKMYNDVTPYLTGGIYQEISNGLWAIEPHIGDHEFGVKFEEILVIEGDSITWLNDMDIQG